VEHDLARHFPIRIVLQRQFQKDGRETLRKIGATGLKAKSIRLLQPNCGRSE